MGRVAAPNERVSPRAVGWRAATHRHRPSRHQRAVLLADEPTGNLDPDLSLEIMSLFREINAKGATVLIATHDRELIRRVDRRSVMLDNGRIVEAA